MFGGLSDQSQRVSIPEMNKKPIRAIFVVGAGASAEFGLPVGRELLTAVAEQCSSNRDGLTFDKQSYNRDFIDAVELLAVEGGMNPYGHFAKEMKRIHTGAPLSSSIDRFIYVHRNNKKLTELAKLAISAILLQGEMKSTLAPSFRYNDVKKGDSFFNILYQVGQNFPNGTEKTRAPVYSWLTKLFRHLAEDASFDAFLLNLSSVAFICFNYDRCIERFLLVAARDFFPEDEFDPKRVLSHLNIVHPYGTVGEAHPRLDGEEWFGLWPSARRILDASRKIRTFTETVQDTTFVDLIDEWLDQTNYLVFLGYGFLSINNELLQYKGRSTTNEVYATALGLPDRDKQMLSGIIRKHIMGLEMHNPFSGDPVYWHDGTCSELFDQFGLQFTSYVVRQRKGYGYF